MPIRYKKIIPGAHSAVQKFALGTPVVSGTTTYTYRCKDCADLSLLKTDGKMRHPGDAWIHMQSKQHLARVPGDGHTVDRLCAAEDARLEALERDDQSDEQDDAPDEQALVPVVDEQDDAPDKRAPVQVDEQDDAPDERALVQVDEQDDAPDERAPVQVDEQDEVPRGSSTALPDSPRDPESEQQQLTTPHQRPERACPQPVCSQATQYEAFVLEKLAPLVKGHELPWELKKTALVAMFTDWAASKNVDVPAQVQKSLPTYILNTSAVTAKKHRSWGLKFT